MADGQLLLDPPVEPRLIDADEFLRMVEAGVFAEDERKIELDDGRIVVAPMDGGPHLNVGMRLAMIWTPRIAADPDLKSRLRLYVPGAIWIAEQVVRAPDAMLAPPGTVGKSRWPKAREALLAVEFSDTTLKYDDGKKRQDYARGGLAELWIVRVEHQDVRVCRGPRADGGWDEADLHVGDALIAPLAAPALALRVRDLFAD
jgi:Uma2 family endonuclease